MTNFPISKDCEKNSDLRFSNFFSELNRYLCTQARIKFSDVNTENFNFY